MKHLPLLLLLLCLPVLAEPSLDRDKPLAINSFQLDMEMASIEKKLGKPLMKSEFAHAYKPGLIAGKKDGKISHLTVLGGGKTWKLKQGDEELIWLGRPMVGVHQVLGIPDERYEMKEHFKAFFHVYRLPKYDLGVQFIDGKVSSYEIHHPGKIDTYIDEYEKL